jgi:hypothetical protein
MKPIPGGCGQNFLFCTLRKTNIAPLSVRLTALDACHCSMARINGRGRALFERPLRQGSRNGSMGVLHRDPEGESDSRA